MSATSKRWLQEHHSDHYVKQAKQQGYCSRAAYKLLELQQKYRLFKPGMSVVDLGAAPGGWSQVALELVGAKGAVIALDLLPMTPLPGVDFIQGDFNEEAVYQALLTRVRQHRASGLVDLVISDMAPNISGIKGIDQPRSLHLVEIAWECAEKVLAKDGVFLAKIFQGPGVDQLLKALRGRFLRVRLCKPSASRARSSEIYICANGFLRYNQEAI